MVLLTKERIKNLGRVFHGVIFVLNLYVNLVVQFEKISELSTHRIDFYTVRIEDNLLTEFEIFDGKEFNQEGHIKELEIIYTNIEEMSRRGAKRFFFRPERGADALPRYVPQAIIDANEDDYGIRLYCIRISDELLILLNGDIKTELNPQDCPNVRPHFLNAVAIARGLDKAIINRDLNIKTGLDGFEIEI